LSFIITLACLDRLDGACVAVCPVDCIYEGLRARYINPTECIDCGACEPVCPVQAIYNRHDVPNHLKSFIDDNAAFFSGRLSLELEPLGNPGGARKLGKIGRDTPLIAAIPSAKGR
jgi:NAD-dependent dihydropyrimidine dehydrogenase PreA subunit